MDLFKTSLVTLGCVLVGACASVKNDSNATSAKAGLENSGVPYTAGAFVAEAGRGNQAAVKEFLDAGMSVNINPNITALQAAVATGQNNMVKYLLENGADVNEDNYLGTALTLAAFSRNYEAAKLLISNGAKVDFLSGDGFTALGAAVYMNDPKMIDLLVKNGADVNFVYKNIGREYLGVAAVLGYYEATKALVDNGADINYVGYGNLTALDWSVFGAHNNITKFLIEHGASLKPGANNAVPIVMMGALSHQDIPMIEYLVSKGIDVNGTYHGKMPILSWCIKNNLTKSAIELIKLGANVNAKTQLGSTALDVALMTGNKEVVKAIDPKFDLSKVPPVPTDPNIIGQAAAITNLTTSEFKPSQDNVVENIQMLINNSGLPTSVESNSQTISKPVATPNPSLIKVNSPAINSTGNESEVKGNTSGPNFNDFNQQINEDMKNIDQSLNNSSDDNMSSKAPSQKDSIDKNMNGIDSNLNSNNNGINTIPDASQK